MTELNSKEIAPDTNFHSLSSLQDKLESIDVHTTSFFKLALFSNVPANYESVREFFAQYTSSLIKNQSNISFFRFYLAISFHSFKKVFLEQMTNDIKNLRNRWLISHCQAIELYGLDAKASQHYFQSFETNKTSEYISNFESVENWIQNEYNKIRLKVLISVLKNKSNFVVFWFAILFFLVFCLVFAARDNSFTIAQQVKVWIHFIVGKN
ncbi:MAG: hypothetical protein V4591_07115 [Bdellovibrionota bacterium]